MHMKRIPKHFSDRVLCLKSVFKSKMLELQQNAETGFISITAVSICFSCFLRVGTNGQITL